MKTAKSPDSQFNHRNTNQGLKMKDSNALRLELDQYYGGDTPYRHSLVRNFFYTSGVRYFLQHAGNGAYWFVDIVATEPQIRHAVNKEGFCICVLKVSNGAGMIAVANDYSEGHESELVGIHFTRAIHNTDCPEGIWKFYLEPTEVGPTRGIMMMLPGER